MRGTIFASTVGITVLLVAGAASAQDVFSSGFESGDTSGWSATVPPLGMLFVGTGDFIMGDEGGYPDEQPVHTVFLDQFWIDKTEVTLAAYVACVDGGGCPALTPSDGCNWEVAGRENHPVNCVSWNHATSYCAWAGKRLPSEAEWEKAARGAAPSTRTWPWGEDGEPEAAGICPPAQTKICRYAVLESPGGCDGCGEWRTWPVGSKPLGASPYGALDMAGNVREWVNDWYAGDYYEECGTPENRYCSNPPGPASGTTRVYRGGGYYWDGPYFSRCSSRPGDVPWATRRDYGFRCAWDWTFAK